MKYKSSSSISLELYPKICVDNHLWNKLLFWVRNCFFGVLFRNVALSMEVDILKFTKIFDTISY